jgi:hypothetical protein
VAIPTIADVFPADVELNPDAAGKPTARDIRFAVVGKNLKQVSLTEVTRLAGPATLTNAALAGGAIVLSAKVSDIGTVIFNLPWNFTNTDGKVTAMPLYTPPINVSVRLPLTIAPPDNAPVTVVKTLQTQAPAAGSPTEYIVQIAPKADEKTVANALSIVTAEINKNKPTVIVTNTIPPNKP